MCFSRSDVYTTGESGGEVFEELRRILSTDVSLQEMLNTMNNQRTETFDEVVARYRRETGLEVLSDTEESIKTAAVKQGTFISKRHKIASKTLEILKQHPEVVKDIESFCVHSGGTKSLHAIIHHLRERLGKEDISYSDEDLIAFIKDKLNEHNQTFHQDFDAGKVGLDTAKNHSDMTADYITHSTPKPQ